MGERELKLKFTAEDHAGGVADGLLTKIKALKKEQRASGEMAFEKVLKGGAGGMANIGLDALGVGLPAMIAEHLGNSLKEATGKLIEIRQQLREGKTDAAGLWSEFAKTLPVIGGIYATGENIRELLTGERAEIERINEDARATNVLLDLKAKRTREIKEQFQATADQAERLRLQIAGVGLVGVAKVANEYQEKLVDLSEKNEQIAKAKARQEELDNPDWQKDFTERKKLIQNAREREEEERPAADRDAFNEATDRLNASGKDWGSADRDKLTAELLAQRPIVAEIARLEKELTDAQKAREKAATDAANAVGGNFQQRREKAAKEQQQELGDLERDRHEAARASEEKVGESREQIAISLARMRGQKLAEVELQVEAQKNAKLVDIDARTRRELRGQTDAATIQDIQNRAEAEKKAVREQADQDLAERKQELAQQAQELVRKKADAEAQAETATRQNALHAQGQFLEEELAQIRAARDQRIRDLDTQAQHEAENNADQAHTILATAAAEKQKAQAEADKAELEARRRFGTEKAKAAADAAATEEQAAGEAREETLRRQGRGYEAALSRIERERAAKVKELQAQATRELETADAGRRADLVRKRDADIRKANQDAARETRALALDQMGTRSFANPAAVNDRYATGVAAKTREENDPWREFRTKGLRLQEQMLEALVALARKAQSPAPTALFGGH